MFNRYKTKEELLKAVEETITQEGEEYFIPKPEEPENKESKEQLDKEIERSKTLRKRSQEAEAKVKELEEEVTRMNAKFEAINQLNPEQLQEKLQKYASEKAELVTEVAKLKDQLEPLQTKVTRYEQRDKETKIKTALIDEAKKQNVRPEAFRDVERLAGQLEIDVDGMLYTKEGNVALTEFLTNEIKLSPHWMPVSRGGGADPGTGTTGTPDSYASAKKTGDIRAMIGSAPTILNQ